MQVKNPHHSTVHKLEIHIASFPHRASPCWVCTTPHHTQSAPVTRHIDTSSCIIYHHVSLFQKKLIVFPYKMAASSLNNPGGASPTYILPGRFYCKSDTGCDDQDVHLYRPITFPSILSFFFVICSRINQTVTGWNWLAGWPMTSG